MDYKGQRKMRSHLLLIVPAVCLLVFSGCSENYQPVAESKCPEVVKHTSKILGKFAKPKAEMMQQCKSYSDVQRGCAMQATIVADLAKCAKL